MISFSIWFKPMWWHIGYDPPLIPEDGWRFYFGPFRIHYNP